MDVKDIKFIQIHVPNQIIEMLDEDRKSIIVYKYEITGDRGYVTEYKVEDCKE